jgi:hypothetical protein
MIVDIAESIVDPGHGLEPVSVGWNKFFTFLYKKRRVRARTRRFARRRDRVPVEPSRTDPVVLRLRPPDRIADRCSVASVPPGPFIRALGPAARGRSVPLKRPALIEAIAVRTGRTSSRRAQRTAG